MSLRSLDNDGAGEGVASGRDDAGLAPGPVEPSSLAEPSSNFRFPSFLRDCSERGSTSRKPNTVCKVSIHSRRCGCENYSGGRTSKEREEGCDGVEVRRGTKTNSG